MAEATDWTGTLLEQRYFVARGLGHGGMAQVYEAEDRRVRSGEVGGAPRYRRVAVKRPHPSADPARFRQESEILAGVTHPNIVTVLDCGRHNDVPFLVMEYVPGADLRGVIRDGSSRDFRFATECIRQLALALAELHDKKVLHRDVKPANIMLLAGRVTPRPHVKLLDLGIAKIRGEPGHTQTNQAPATVPYMSPEQVEGCVLDERSDLFSLGVVWLELLTGTNWFQACPTPATTDGEVFDRIRHGDRPTEIAGVPADASDLLLGLLSSDPTKRTPRTARELVRRLDLLLGIDAAHEEVTDVQTKEATPRRRSVSARAESPLVRPVLTAVIVAVAALLVVWATRAQPTPLTQAAPPRLTEQRLSPLPPSTPAPKELVDLGRALYNDMILSKNEAVSCASCHPIGLGGTTVEKRTVRGFDNTSPAYNTPSTWNTSVNYRFGWRADASTFAAILERPLAGKSLMGNLAADGKSADWPAILGRLRNSARYSVALFPAAGRRIEQGAVVEALAAYLEYITPRDAPAERAFESGNFALLGADADHGHALFEQLGCVSCHQGSGVGGNMVAVFGAMLADPYEGRGQCDEVVHGYCRSDDDCGRCPPGEQCTPIRCENIGRSEVRLEDKGFNGTYEFRVPSLRNVAATGPYFHDGSATTLREAITTMAHVQLGRELNDSDTKQIEAFLKTLTGTLPVGEESLSGEAAKAAFDDKQKRDNAAADASAGKHG